MRNGESMSWLRIKTILDPSLSDECHHCWWRLYNHKFNCTRNRRMLKSWAAKTQCYDLLCYRTSLSRLSLSISLCDTDLLYLPRELRSSSISAWCCSSKVSIDFGWILGDIPSPMPMSWNWNITLCKGLTTVLTRGPPLTMAWVWAQDCPRLTSPPGSRGECGL